MEGLGLRDAGNTRRSPFRGHTPELPTGKEPFYNLDMHDTAYKDDPDVTVSLLDGRTVKEVSPVKTSRTRILFLAAAAALAGAVFLFWNADASCEFANVEPRINTIWAQREMLSVALQSWKAGMPCFPKFHLTVPAPEVQLFRGWVEELELPNMVVHADGNPPNISKWLRPQYADFMADTITDAQFIMGLDTDIMLATPATCGSFFDERGRPYLMYLDRTRVNYVEDQIVLKRAKDNKPDKWAYTHEDVDKLGTASFMSYFPVIWHRDVTRTVREIVKDAAGVDDFDQALSMTIDYTPTGVVSQFDLFGKVAWLLFHDEYHFLGLAPPEIAFAPDAPVNYTEVHDFSLSIVHVSYHHQDDLRMNLDYPDPQWIAYASLFAKHLLCCRQAGALGPVNSYSTDGFFNTTILTDWDGDCSAPEMKLPFKEIHHYADNWSRWKPDVWAEQYWRSRKQRRKGGLCSNPVR